MSEKMCNCPPMSAELAALLEKAKNYKPTPEEIYLQKRSWLIGETGISHPDWSRDASSFA